MSANKSPFLMKLVKEKEVPSASLALLSNDCLACIFNHLPDPTCKVRVSWTCKILYARVHEREGCAWRHVQISGSPCRIAILIHNCLVKHAQEIKSLYLQDITASNQEDVREDDALGFHVSHLFKAMSTSLAELTMIESKQNLFFPHAYEMAESIAKYSTELRYLSLGGGIESAPFPSEAFLLLCMGCPKIQTFHDRQTDGVGLKGIRMMLDGWSSLTHLSLNTESMHVIAFFRALKGFGRARLQSLEFCHFLDPLLDEQAWFIIKQGLGWLNVHEISIDLQLTPFQDGLEVSHWVELLDACPNITRIFYSVGIEAYLTEEEFSCPSTAGKPRTDSGVANETNMMMVQHCGTSFSADSRSFLDRVILPNASAQETRFLEILDGLQCLCRQRQVECEITWSII